ncbi:MAG: hypothetical protein ACRECG_17025 [Bradyrhizobium sp.]
MAINAATVTDPENGRSPDAAQAQSGNGDADGTAPDFRCAASGLPVSLFNCQTAKHRHCEPTGRANARLMTGSAKQSMARQAEAWIASSLALLAMTRTAIQ